ncbi:MAG: hypothetical protein EU543_01095 [Promethearchaeota archaeon]|nr:MAG: hypothetical protein EU543_01095 [Candidatus Lokiarchaeota archaeon]
MTSQLDESKEHLEDEQLEYHHFFITEDLWHLFDRAILAGVGLVTVLILLILTIKISTNTLNILKLLEF